MNATANDNAVFVSRIAPARSSRKRAAQPLPVEQGMVENHAERPYNRLQRAALEFLGLVLGRRIV